MAGNYDPHKNNIPGANGVARALDPIRLISRLGHRGVLDPIRLIFGGHKIYILGQNFKLTFTPLDLVQSSPFDLKNDQQDRPHLLTATCAF